MEDTAETLTQQYYLSSATNHRFSDRGEKEIRDKGDDDDGEDDDDEECDMQAWETLIKSFKDVQSVLDHNRVLIKQVNKNHQSKVPDNLVQNFALIREINGNISKVMGIYSHLSVNFSNIVQQRRALTKSNSGTSNSNR